MEQHETERMAISHSSDVGEARRHATALARAGGFDDTACAAIGLVATELASNLVKHAGAGTLTLRRIVDGERSGVQLEAHDDGPGLADVAAAMADGFSTAGTLGNGLGAVNRLMDELRITSAPGLGTHVICRRWRPSPPRAVGRCPLSFGVATRPMPYCDVNGDAFVVQQWGQSALVAVIDGLGHGPEAHRASRAAASYVESHCEQPLEAIFVGAGHACRSTRGVVMALARFDWAESRLTFASVGNIEAKVFGSPEPLPFRVRRGIVGVNAPHPLVTTHAWPLTNVLVLHSDGLTTHWAGADYLTAPDPAASIAFH